MWTKEMDERLDQIRSMPNGHCKVTSPRECAEILEQEFDQPITEAQARERLIQKGLLKPRSNNNGGGGLSWSPEHTAALKDMWTVKGYSASQCGSLLTKMGRKTTRNSALSKIHRENWESPHSRRRAPKRWGVKDDEPQQLTRRPPRQTRRKPKKKALPENVVPLVDFDGGQIPENARLKTLEFREQGECCWPLDRDKNGTRRFCAADVAPGTSYCSYHHEQRTAAFVPRERRRRPPEYTARERALSAL